MARVSRSAFRFFCAHAGYVVGRRAEGALQLARAEQWARENGASYVWDYDPDGDLGDHEYWCNDARREAAARTMDGEKARTPGTHEHAIECVLAYDAAGEIIGSLCGIIDADANYRRVVEAEIVSEAMPRNDTAYSYGVGAA